MNQARKEKLIQKTLSDVNKIRYKMGLEPVDEFIPGYLGDPHQCVLANSIKGKFTTRISVAPIIGVVAQRFGEPRAKRFRMTWAMKRFMWAYDAHKFPQFDKAHIRRLYAFQRIEEMKAIEIEHKIVRFLKEDKKKDEELVST